MMYEIMNELMIYLFLKIGQYILMNILRVNMCDYSHAAIFHLQSHW